MLSTSVSAGTNDLAALSGMAVLVVDDDDTVRDLVSDYLSANSSLAVHTAGDVDAGLACLDDADDVACIVSDYQLPGRDGLAFAEAVRERGCELPFVLLTGRGSEAVAAEAFDAGVDDYVVKRPGAAGLRPLVRRVETLARQHVTERALERERDRFRTLVEASTDLLTILDEDGRYRYLGPAVERVFGYSADELLGRDAFELVHPDDRAALRERFADAVDSPDGSVEAVEYRYRTADGGYRWFESAGTSRKRSAEGYVVDTRDITERVRRAASLDALNEAMHTLIRSPPDEPIGTLATETALDVSAASNVAYYGWDDDRGVLERRAHSWADGGPAASHGPESPVWEAFIDEETVALPPDATAAVGDDLPERECLLVPVAYRGLLVLAGDEPFDDVDLDVAETLASGYRALLERRSHTRQLRETERELRARNEELTRLDQVHGLVRSVGQSVVRASDRGEIAEAVCTELASSDLVGCAWFGIPGDDETVEVLAAEGADPEFVDRVAALNESTADAPAATALRTRETVVVRDLMDDGRCEPVRRAALGRGLRGVVSCPVTHNGVTYGVLEAYVTVPSVLDEQVLGVVDDLRETVGYACSSVVQRRRGGGRDFVEVAVDVTDADDAVAHLAERSGVPLSVTGVVGHPECWHVTVETPDRAAVYETATEQRSIDHVERLAGGGLAVHVERFPVRQLLGEYAGTFLRFDVDGPRATLVARLPRHVAVREFVAALERIGTDVTLRRKEQVTADEPIPDGGMDDLLTPRQREVLTVAYDLGYFASPRESSGTAVAEALDISPPTFHDHRRKAVNAFVTEFLGTHG